MRLQSDFELSRGKCPRPDIPVKAILIFVSTDSRTACLWQAMISTYILSSPQPPSLSLTTKADDQTRMQTQFKAVMHKLELLGQPDTLVDCSDVVPVPAPFKGQAVFPATFSRRDIQQAVRLPISLFLIAELTVGLTSATRSLSPLSRPCPVPRPPSLQCKHPHCLNLHFLFLTCLCVVVLGLECRYDTYTHLISPFLLGFHVYVHI